MFIDHDVVQHFALVYHLSSVELVERYVQMGLSRISVHCVQAGTMSRIALHWTLHLQTSMIDINTGMVKIFRLTPAEVIISFNLVATRMRCIPEVEWHHISDNLCLLEI